MRIATRTALAGLAAAVVSVLAIGVVARREFETVLRNRVDRQLEQRAASARVLAVVATRLADSKLSPTVQPSRVRLPDGGVINLGTLPAQSLPPLRVPGWGTAQADGQRWRLLTVEVNLPNKGGRALVQMVESLGSADAAASQLRRRFVLFGSLGAIGAALAGWLFGSVASRPLNRLRRDAASIDPQRPATWSVADRYGAIEVDELADALRDGLHRVGDETDRREAALAASRSFAASAAHELRTPLQSALLNLGVASDPRTDEATRLELLEASAQLLQRMGTALGAVRALADAEVADPSWFEPADLADVVDRAVAEEVKRRDDVMLTMSVEQSTITALWCDGVQMAVGNVVRNALVHGAPPDGSGQRIEVTVRGATVFVDDNGVGIPVADRERVVERFERGSTSAAGSGLGLSICKQVAAAHGGTLTLGDSPLGGTRVVLTFAPAT